METREVSGSVSELSEPDKMGKNPLKYLQVFEIEMEWLAVEEFVLNTVD